jgi:methylated-DNA-[protein]-cysteine S-methyltransferase
MKTKNKQRGLTMKSNTAFEHSGKIIANNSYSKMKTPIGELTLIADEKNLLAVLWPNEKMERVKIPWGEENKNHPVLKETARQLNEYFAGKRRDFDLPLRMVGTDFQSEVWKGLREIPFGKTSNYAELAVAVGRPKAVRAAGAANGRNPLSIVVPCHRVIGKNGELVGFAGGLETKKFLLALEQK